MPELILHRPFYAPQLERNKTIRVLLPRNYYTAPDRRFPVIYLQDGQNLFDAHTAAFKHWKLRETMQRQPLNRQAILVGIDHSGLDRMHEYAPFKRGQHGGEGIPYLQFIAHTLKPFIDTHYRTWEHREATGIVGSSLGGLITFYAGLQFSHVFGKVGALSPSIWFNPHVLEVARHHTQPKSKMYVAGSKTEMGGMKYTLEQTYWALKAGNFADDDIRIVIRERGKHSETFWATEFKKMYEWLFPTTVL